MEIAVIMIIALLSAGAAVLMILLLRRQRQEDRLKGILGVGMNEDLEAAAKRISEQAAICDEIPRLKHRLDRMLETSPLPLLLVGEDRVIINVSRSAEQELDQPRRRRGLLETMESHELDDAVRMAIETREPAELTLRLYASGRRPFRIWLFPYEAVGSRECLIFLQDASEAVDYGQLRSQFAATVSHELRTPLAAIRALLDNLKEPGVKPDEADRLLDRVNHETDRLWRLIDEILFLSTLESGESISELEGESVLNEVAEAVLEKNAPAASEFDIQLENRVPVDIIIPLPERMATMVTGNLLTNAIRYSGRGSKVVITAARAPGAVSITVKDDGIGIDAEHLPHIFERFYRVDKSRSRRLGGTGLGLSIVKHIIESAGGKVEASSREGFGTEIRITLPLPGSGPSPLPDLE